jgi:hypothetical protein
MNLSCHGNYKYEYYIMSPTVGAILTQQTAISASHNSHFTLTLIF